MRDASRKLSEPFMPPWALLANILGDGPIGAALVAEHKHVHLGNGAKGLVAYSLSTAFWPLVGRLPTQRGLDDASSTGKSRRLAKFLPGWVMQAAHTG